MSADAVPRLIIIAPSHFCEKARWGLERYSVSFHVEAHAPGFHKRAVKGKGSTPCLIFPDGTYRDDSTLILRWIDEQPSSAGKPKLFPADCEAAVAAECALYDAGLGVDARSVVYAHILDSNSAYYALMANVPGWQRAIMGIGAWYVVRGVMRKGMRISPENGRAALERIRSEFQRVGKLLEDGRPYLCGGAFTAADLTFVALAAPVLGFPYSAAPVFANDAEMPPALRDICVELRATPAGLWAMKMWKQERLTVV